MTGNVADFSTLPNYARFTLPSGHTPSCLAWRPYLASQLVIGTTSAAVFLVDVADPAAAPVQLPAPTSLAHTFGGRAAPQSVLTLEFSPDGLMLAAAVQGVNGAVVYDVSMRTCTVVSGGSLGPDTVLRWSPSISGGGHLLAGSPCLPTYRLYNTSTWRSSEWAGSVKNAYWSADGLVALLQLADTSSTLTFLHLKTPTTQDPQAQALQLHLKGVTTAAGTRATNPLDEEVASDAGTAPVIESFAWDAKAQRLAVLLGGGHTQPGRVAMYLTESRPTLSVASYQGTLGPDLRPAPATTQTVTLRNGTLIVHSATPAAGYAKASIWTCSV